MLNTREREILTVLSQGATNQQIADQLYLSVYTVKDYLKGLYTKLNVHSRDQAIAMGRALALIRDDELISPVPLPTLGGPLFGRHTELHTLSAWLAAPHPRLISLVGPGGIGKTHLAIAVAHHVADQFPDGTVLLRLADATTGDALWTMIAAHLDTPTHDDSPASITAALADCRCLLILDNAEQMRDLGSIVSQLIRQTQHLKILVTSRAGLGVAAEQQFQLDSMDDAPDLFLYRIQHQHPDYRPTSDDRQLIARICEAAGAMPLAVLMAANWWPQMSLADIYNCLQHNALILDTPQQDPLDQSRDLGRILTQTWALLSADEQAALMDFSVFSDSATFEAVEAVVRADLQVLDSLINKSLLAWNANTRRYSMHPLVRQYAQHHSEAAHQEAATRARLLAFLIQQAAQTPIQDHAWVFDVHHHDVWATLRYLLDTDQLEAAVSMLRGLMSLWTWRGFNRHIEYWFDELAAYRLEETQPAILADILRRAGRSAFAAANYVHAENLLVHSSRLYEYIGDLSGWVMAQVSLAMVYFQTAALDQANEIFSACFQVAHRGDDPIAVFFARNGLGMVAVERYDYPTAIGHYRAALAIIDKLPPTPDHDRFAASLVNNIGLVLMRQNHLEQAKIHFEMALNNPNAQQSTRVVLHENLGITHLRLGNLGLAEQYLREAAKLCAEANHIVILMRVIEHFAELARLQNRPANAARYLGAADALRAATATERLPIDAQSYDDISADLAEVLGRPTYTDQWQTGYRTPLVTLIAELVP